MKKEEAVRAIYSNEELHKKLTDSLVKFANDMSRLNGAYIEALSEVNEALNERIEKIRKEIGYEGDSTVLQ